MGNKYRQLQPLDPASAQALQKPVQRGMDGGYRGDVSPREIPFDSSPELSEIRFERGAIRKDFGWTAIGAAAPQVIIGLIEHKYIDAQLQFHRLVRFYVNGTNNLVLEVWDGVNWVLTDTSAETVTAAYLSMVSALNCLYAANGEFVFRWCEELEKTLQENDFPESNAIGIIGFDVQATVTPASATALEYSINYDVQIDGNPGGTFPPDTSLTLEFYHGSTLLGSRQFVVTASQGLVNFDDQSFLFTRIINDLDVVSIRMAEVTGGLFQNEAELFALGGGGEPDIVAPKNDVQPADSDEYQFFIVFDSVPAMSTAQAEILVEFNSNPGAFFAQTIVQGTNNTGSAAPVAIEPTVVIEQPLNDFITRFGINSLTGGVSVDPGNTVEWSRRQLNLSVHGHNKAVNLDEPAGVTYETTGAIVSVFEPIDPGPGGRFLTFFARRLVVLRNFGDSQSLAWSRDGLLEEFTGSGSGEIILVESRSDPVDDLMGTAVLSSNFMALFRRRSIMRVFETGNPELALGAVSWIENLGTNYPFSIRNVRGGVIFLGHDQMVYFLTEGGPVAIGLPIHQDLIETLTGDLSLVDSGWDPTFGEYYLGIPEGAATTITLAWIFDVDRFLDQQEIVWRKRPMTVQRFAAFGVSEVE